MRLWAWPALVQVMDCSLFGVKPSSQLMLPYSQLDTQEQNLMTFGRWRKCVWNVVSEITVILSRERSVNDAPKQQCALPFPYTGWLEPLLEQLIDRETNVVCPIIGTVDHLTFQVLQPVQFFIGGFDWDMVFNWKPMSPRENQRRGGDEKPYR